MILYEKERTYLKWKYFYYNGQTLVTDPVFDALEDDIRELGSTLPNIVGSPTMNFLEKYNLVDEIAIGEREIRFKHKFSMLSLKKYPVTVDKQEKELFPSDIVNFFNKVKGNSVGCTSKFDGNSMELIYNFGILNQSLTRGNEDGGLDRTKYMKHIVPNELPKKYHSYDEIIIRGECIIETEKWEQKYSDPNEVDNPRNWLAGVFNADDSDINIMNDIDFLGFHIVMIKNSQITKPNNQLDILVDMGFEKVFTLTANSAEDFFMNVYPRFKEYRSTCKYLLDGIVLSFSPEYWDSLGENNHHPHWACAVKFPPNRAITYLEKILWSLGKDGEYTPIGLFKPIELDGTIVKHASLHNLGWVIENKVYPGCKVEIAKKGEIIPQVTSILEQSIDEKEYDKYINEIIEELT